MTSHDLKDLLQTMAADGTDRVPLDEQTLIPRIRSRRRRRTGLATAVAASTAIVVAAGAYAVLPGGDQNQPQVAAPTPTVTLKPDRVKGFACGSTLTGSIVGDEALRFEVSGQAVTADSRGLGELGIQLTNTTSEPLDLFGGPSIARIVVVKDGVVVATPLAEHAIGKPWKFDPGQTVTSKVFLDAHQCTTDGVPGTTPLAAGTYQIYATKDFQANSDTGRSGTVAAGGPWTIELK
jgi:hypothetical protein